MIRKLTYFILGCLLVFLGLQGYYLFQQSGNLKIFIQLSHHWEWEEKETYPRSIVVELDGETILDEHYQEREWLRAKSMWSPLGKHRIKVVDAENSLAVDETFNLFAVKWVIIDAYADSLNIRYSMIPPVFE